MADIDVMLDDCQRMVEKLPSVAEHKALRELNADMLAALRLHKAWKDSEATGPDYGGQSRNTHPDGEKIWRAWWNNQLDLCARAEKATDLAIAKAEGRS